MPLDANLFTQGAQLRNQNAANLSAQLQNAVNLYASGQERKANGLDVVKLAVASAYKKAAGLPITEEEDALAQGWDKIQSKYVALDQLGRPYRKQEPIFGAIANASEGAYTPTYTQGSGAPYDKNPAATQPPVGGAVPNVVKGKDDPNDYNTVSIDDKALNELYEGNVPPGLKTDALLPPQDSPVFKAPSVAEGMGGRLDANNPEVLKADIDTQKAINTEQAKAKIGQTIDRENLKKMEIDTLPVLDKMLKLNEATVDAPFAGLIQPAMRGASIVSPEASTKANAMDALMQQRTALAAPLAKQLGVNPTDKDFQATLDRIFNANSTKEGRRQQIQNLIDQTNTKYGIKDNSQNKPVSFPSNFEGKRIRNDQTGKIGIIKNGAWVEQ